MAVSRETFENTKNSESQNKIDPGRSQKYISQVSEEDEGKVTQLVCREINWTQSRILGALSKLDEFLLKPQGRTCSVAVPGTSSNIDSEYREPIGDRYLGDRCPIAMFSTHHSNNPNDSEQEATHHRSNR